MAAEPFSRPVTLSDDYPTGSVFMGVRLLGALELDNAPVDGIPVVELSALAWDADGGVLYALSDHGRLVHLRPEFKNGRLVAAKTLAAFPLKSEDGAILYGRQADAEGMAIRNGRNGIPGDETLVISFERRPRILEYRPDGNAIRSLPLADALRERKNFASSNKALESVTLHPLLGLLTAPEWPLRNARPGWVPLMRADGQTWPYPLRERAKNALVAIEALPDGSLLMLERSFTALLGTSIGLRTVKTIRVGAEKQELAPENIAIFNSSDGWQLDNFEGLARHQGKRFFMVSDDNENAFQRTLLLYFEVL